VATLELFCWLDFRTQLAWGAIAYKHYNRYTVGQALTNAVSWGMPQTVYTDWGKPEQSDYISLLLDQLTGLGIKTQDIRQVNARVRNPQAKPIEGWFGNLDRKLKNRQLPGYCKRLKDSRESELQQKDLKEQIRAGRLLSIDEMVEEIFATIEEWNNHAFKNRGPDNGKSPLEIYSEETRTYPVTTLAKDTLDYIFLPLQETVIRRSQVKVKHPWLRTLTYYDPELANWTGREAVVRFNPFDPQSVWVFLATDTHGHTRTGKLICCAEEWGMINPKNKDQVMDRIALQNHLLKTIRERYRSYLPEKPTIPRISPHDREAKQIQRTEDRRRRAAEGEGLRAVGGLRVLTTQLEAGSEEHRAKSTKLNYRSMYSMDQPVQREERPAVTPFRLTIGDEVEEED